MIIKVGGGLEPLGPIGVYAYVCDFFKSVNIWQSYEQERGCFMHFVRLENTLASSKILLTSCFIIIHKSKKAASSRVPSSPSGRQARHHSLRNC